MLYDVLVFCSIFQDDWLRGNVYWRNIIPFLSFCCMYATPEQR